jgi:hypothetical protein
MELTQSLLKELLHYAPDTGVFTRFSENAGSFNGAAGCVVPRGYVSIWVAGKVYRAHRLAWLYMTGEWPENETDHINGKRADNRFINLRSVTHEENNQNKSISRRNKSGCTGVTKKASNGRWLAQIMANNERIHLGVFDDIKDAIAARRSAEVKYGFHENHGRSVA